MVFPGLLKKKKTLGYFNGKIILTSFVLPLPVPPSFFVLSLNEVLSLLLTGKSIIATLLFKGGSSL